jgi:hypothetical protein
MCAICPPILSWFCHSNSIWWRVQIMTVLIIWFCQTLFPLYSERPSVYTLPKEWQNKFHARVKKLVKLWFFYILIFRFFYRWRGGRKFILQVFPEFHLLFTSSWMKLRINLLIRFCLSQICELVVVLNYERDKMHKEAIISWFKILWWCNSSRNVTVFTLNLGRIAVPSYRACFLRKTT